MRVISPGEILKGNGISLRLCELSDCSENYVSWLADPEVNRYLETRWSAQTIDSIRVFVGSMIESPHSYLFAILLDGDSPSGKHVGNIKVGPVIPHHDFADVSYFIGDRNAWGRGLATEAVRVATRFGFERLKLHRLQAGLYETNVGSFRVLEKAGYVYEGRLRKQLRGRDDWEDHVWFGALADSWRG
jgi:[ribosomal protein S5]-alanine N-acetyltransferase